MKTNFKIKSLAQLYDVLPEQERIMLDVLRQIVLDHLPSYCKEKISFNVPYFYGKKGICIIWPASVPRGGIRSGVLLGFWYGSQLIDEDNYLKKGTNKRIYYKIYQSVEEIDEQAIGKLLKEALLLEQSY